MSSDRNVVSLIENNLTYAQKLELRNKLGQVRKRTFIRRRTGAPMYETRRPFYDAVSRPRHLATASQHCFFQFLRSWLLGATIAKINCLSLYMCHTILFSRFFAFVSSPDISLLNTHHSGNALPTPFSPEKNDRITDRSSFPPRPH